MHMFTCTQREAVIGDAQRVFDRMEERDVITWTAMTGGIAQHGCGVKAYERTVPPCAKRGLCT
jgi:hypothetical protein